MSAVYHCECFDWSDPNIYNDYCSWLLFRTRQNDVKKYQSVSINLFNRTGSYSMPWLLGDEEACSIIPQRCLRFVLAYSSVYNIYAGIVLLRKMIHLVYKVGSDRIWFKTLTIFQLQSSEHSNKSIRYFKSSTPKKTKWSQLVNFNFSFVFRFEF